MEFEQIVFYLVGFILSYGLIKIFREKNDLNDWNAVLMTLILSMYSWIMVGLIFIFVMTVKIHKLIKSIIFNFPKTPPKWM